MARFKLSEFGGMRPIRSSRLIDETFAERCANVWLRAGSLVPLAEPAVIRRFAGQTIPKAARLLDPGGAERWLPLSHVNSEVFKAPFTNDRFGRYIILDPPGGPLRFNTTARIDAGQPPYLLGLPAPAGGFTVAVTGGAATPVEVRAYVVTFVDEFGQEGPPSDPVVATGSASGTWQLRGLPTVVPDAGERPVVRKRIWRTITSDSSATATYRFVADLPLGDTSYDDTISGPTVALARQLETVDMLPPPTVVDGVVQMPNGFLVAWHDRTLHFSQPFRPWAWPPTFDFAVEHPIVGCGVIGQSLVIATTGYPYIASGNVPEAVTPQKSDAFEPCLSRASIVAGTGGVYYSSANGLVRAAPDGVSVITSDLSDRAYWQRDLAPTIIGAARSGPLYFALTGGGNGFVLSTNGAREALSLLQNYNDIVYMWNDHASDEAFMMLQRGGDSVVLRAAPDILTDVPQVFSWRSKEYVLAQPGNFGVALVQCEGPPLAAMPRTETGANAIARFHAPAPGEQFSLTSPPIGPRDAQRRIGMTSVVGYTGIGRRAPPLAAGCVRGELPPGATGPGWYGYPYWPDLSRQPSRLVDTDLTLPPGVAGRLRVFADRKIVYDEEIVPNEQVRLPSGFLSDVWQVQVTSRVEIHAIHMATTGRELADV